MSDLTEFLLARIAEDEAAAQSCPPWPWRVATTHDEADAHDEQTFAGETVAAADGIAVAAPYALSGPQTRAVRDHIVRHDPARVLAECEAKRRIVQAAHAAFTKPGDDPDAGMADLVFTEVLELLALPYAGHPDYREEWRP